ncbi:DUF397 domain-containing protein [Streptomyces chrestomyceticus]|uniref:DUF397 domain-containing protein n=1 Tax=Streptomyces chrestomyceticus TaxID=68185 RepID=UPI00369641B5
MTAETPYWFKSSYSDNGGACVEAATNLVTSRGVVPIRDSKNPNGPVLTLTPGAWTGLIQFAQQAPRWLKSSYSDNGGQCVEVATNLIASRGVVSVRDSKNPNGPALSLDPDTWAGLIEFVRQATT